MRRALVVGINDYPQAPLKGCVSDASAVARLLATHGTGSPNFDTRLLSSPTSSVTRSSLRQAIEKLFATDCDIALFYFSGHGFVRSGDGYIVTNDAQNYDEGISMTEILNLANRTPARNRIIILDCCYSGRMGTPSIADADVAQIAEGLTVLAASREAEEAMERVDGGIFTNLVIAALEGGAADLRGHITSGSVYAYVDQALGAWDQRPVFKTNVTQFSSLRDINPQVPLQTLRQLVRYFPTPDAEHPLDASYEDQEPNPNPDHVAVFKNLQKMEGVGLVVPVGEEHMYFPAVNSKSCRLTALGAHYWRLAHEGKL